MGDGDTRDISGLPIGVLSMDPGQEILTCDDVFCALFACRTEDVVGRPFDDLISPRDRRGAMAFAASMSRFAGGLVDLLVTLRIGGRDQVTRLRIVGREKGYAVFVEPAQGGQDLLHRFTVLEQRWKGMFRSSKDGIVILDEAGRIVEHNAGFFALMSFRDAHGVSLSEDAVAGRPFLELVGESFPGLRDYLRAPDGDFEVRSVERAQVLELKATPILLPNGDRTGTFLLVRDVAQQLQIEARDAIIRQDLEHARAFQQAILSTPPPVQGHDISVTYRPLDEVGGDIYDVALLDRRAVRLFIADATGHGVPAALVTMLVKGAYESVKRSTDDPAELLAALNDRVATTSASLEALFTATVLDYDLDSRTITYATGGHPPPVLVRSRGHVEELEAGGAIVGAAPGISFPSWTRRLDPTDGIYLVTDGIAEARRAGGEFFGDARLHEVLAEANELSSGVGDAVLARLEGWLRPSKPDDDVTIIGLRPARDGRMHLGA